MNQATAAPASSTMASEKAAVVSQATPVSGREVDGISESDSDSDGEDTAPVSYFC